MPGWMETTAVFGRPLPSDLDAVPGGGHGRTEHVGVEPDPAAAPGLGVGIGQRQPSHSAQPGHLVVVGTDLP